MNNNSKASHIPADTKRMLRLSLATLLAVSLSFIGIIQYFNQTHKQILDDVALRSQQITKNSEIRNSLGALELDIRELLAVGLRKPTRLEQSRTKLLANFERVLNLVPTRQFQKAGTKLLDELRTYRQHLIILLQDYEAINNTLADLDQYHQDGIISLNKMEEDAAQLMVDYALAGRDTSALQQTYILIPFCVEHFLQSQALIDTSISKNDPTLLGLGSPESEETDYEMDSTSNIAIVRKTLLTMTSADKIIGDEARLLLANLKGYDDSITSLGQDITSLNHDRGGFEKQRDAILALLKEMDARTADDIGSIQEKIAIQTKQATATAFFISGIVLLVMILSQLMIRKLGHQLQKSAITALTAKDSLEKVNIELQNEIYERQQVEKSLADARDELEIRVFERTNELRETNLLLEEEIKERKHTEEALAAEKEQLTVTLKSIGDGVITTDIKGEIVLLNIMAEELTGWTSPEAVGRPLREVFHLSGIDKANPVDMVISSGNIVEGHHPVTLIAKDGTERKIANSGAPIRDRNSTVIGVVLVFRDVTTRLMMEEELLKAKKLESVGVLAGGIAHDFNNILTAILGNLNLATMLLDREHEVYGMLKDAEKASLRAKNLTKQLLTFSKGGEPVRETSSIAEIIRDSADFILHGSNTMCQYDLADDLWLVDIDRGQISQVIQNLVMNADQAMPTGGTIRVRGENMVANEADGTLLTPGSRYVKISVHDTGVGIPNKNIDKIFDPYFSTKPNGNGLGLTISHSIIAKHEGQLTVQSDPSNGTTFTIYLPASGRQTHMEEKIKDDAEMQGKGKILLMDDEEAVRSIAKAMLKHLGYEIAAAKDGQEAIDLYKKANLTGEPFDLVIMDLTIPGGMGGKEAVQKILALNSAAKVIVSSGYSTDTVLAHYRDYGFCAAIVKPYRLQELAKILQDSLVSLANT